MNQVPRETWGKAALVVALSLVLIAAVFRLGGQASAGVAFDDAQVWIEHGIEGELLQVNGASGEVTARIPVGEAGDDFRALPHAGGVVVVNDSSGELRLIDSTELVGGQRLTLELADDRSAEDPVELFSEPAAANNVYIVDDDRILDVDLITLDQRVIELESTVGDAIVDSDGGLLVIADPPDQIRRLGLNGFAPFAPLPEPRPDAKHKPQLVRAGDALFVVDPDRRSVSEFRDDETLGPPSCLNGSMTIVLAAGAHVTSTDSTPRVIVHDPDSGVLSVSEPETSRCFEISVDVPGKRFGLPVAVDSLAYLPNWEQGRVEVVDLAERVLLESVPFASVIGQPFELEVFGSTVWANEPHGPFATLFRPDEVITVQKIETIVLSAEGDDLGEDGSTPIIATDGGEGGAQALGTSGDSVDSSSGVTDSTADGVGGPTSDGPSSDSGTSDAQADTVEPLVLGVAVETAEKPPNAETLSAGFNFSSSTAVVDEEVRFVDESSGFPTSWSWEFGDGKVAQGPEVKKSWASEGVYRVALTVSDGSGAESVRATLITVLAATASRPPIADFVFGSSTTEVGEAIEFVSRTVGDPEILEWDLGDGTIAEGTTVVHRFASPGVFTVTLTATNAAGSDAASTTITVISGVERPRASIAGFSTSVEADQFVTLTSSSVNDPTSTKWDLGDGTRAAGTQVRHAWATAGTYRIRLTVSNSAGSDDTFADIQVRPRVDPPIARFSQSGLETFVGQALTFSDLSRNAPTRIRWNFGDGTTAQGLEVSHAWSEPGTYRVVLRVDNEAGGDRKAKTVTVIKPVDPPVAAFFADASTVSISTPVSFTDNSTNDPTSWFWDFGDGNTSTVQNPAHAWAAPGSYVVRLVAENAGGSSQAEDTIEVFATPIASFDFVVDGLRVEFTDRSSNGPTAWNWVFGDGSERERQSPVKNYKRSGTYEVTLVAFNEAGASAPVTMSVSVYSTPNADFNYSADNLTVTFENTSTGGHTAIEWDFGDGASSNESNPTHTFADLGRHTVRLTVTNPEGEDVRQRRVVTRIDPLNADFSCERNDDLIVCDASASTGETAWNWSAAAALEIRGRTTRVATFVFPPCGRYDVTLQVSNDGGDTDSLTRPSPSLGSGSLPEITRVDIDSNGDGEVDLRGRARNRPDSWSWSLPGGKLVDGGGTARPTFTFTENGTYPGTVRATNDCGTSLPFDFTIIIDDLSGDPVASFSWREVNTESTVVFSDQSFHSGGTSWSWDFGGVAQIVGGNESSPVVRFLGGPGSYVVTLVVTDRIGSDSFSDTITVID